MYWDWDHGITMQIFVAHGTKQKQTFDLAYVAQVVSGSGGEDDLGGRIHFERDGIIGAGVDLVVAENSEGNPGSSGVGHFPPAAFF